MVVNQRSEEGKKLVDFYSKKAKEPAGGGFFQVRIISKARFLRSRFRITDVVTVWARNAKELQEYLKERRISYEGFRQLR